MHEYIREIIAKLGLIPHPTEGGYFYETYRSPDILNQSSLSPEYSGNRNVGTAIYYLLTPETVSAMHRLCSDEIFHFYLGDPVEQLLLRDDGSSEVVVLGQNILAGQVLQHVVPKNVWQGARLKAGGRFALLGCTVAPGFDFADYIHGSRDELINTHPDQTEMITALTPDNPVIQD